MKNDKKAYNIVFDHFKNQILSGEIKLGYKLPSERDISDQLGVSRNSVREAIRMLEMMGLVESRQGSGNYICFDPHSYFTQTFNMMMVLQGISYLEIFDTRRTMEMEAFNLAMEHITSEELDQMYAILQKMDEPLPPAQLSKLDGDFHRVLVQASHNTLMTYLIQLMGDLLDIFIEDLRVFILDDPRRTKALRDTHWDILESLAEQDYTLGQAAMQQHFAIVKEQITEFEQRQPDFSARQSEASSNIS